MANNKLILDPEECVLLKSENVSYGSGLTKSVSELILTNKAIIYAKKGLLGGKNHLRFPLDKIKIYENKVQAMQSKNSAGEPSLDIYFLEGQESFAFKNKKDISTWISKMNDLLIKNDSDENKNPVIPGTEFIAKTLKNTIDSCGEIFGFKKKDVKVTIKCPNCGATVTGTKGETKQCPFCDTFVEY